MSVDLLAVLRQAVASSASSAEFGVPTVPRIVPDFGVEDRAER